MVSVDLPVPMGPGHHHALARREVDGHVGQHRGGAAGVGERDVVEAHAGGVGRRIARPVAHVDLGRGAVRAQNLLLGGDHEARVKDDVADDVDHPHEVVHHGDDDEEQRHEGADAQAPRARERVAPEHEEGKDGQDEREADELEVERAAHGALAAGHVVDVDGLEALELHVDVVAGVHRQQVAHDVVDLVLEAAVERGLLGRRGGAGAGRHHQDRKDQGDGRDQREPEHPVVPPKVGRRRHEEQHVGEEVVLDAVKEREHRIGRLDDDVQQLADGQLVVGRLVTLEHRAHDRVAHVALEDGGHERVVPVGEEGADLNGRQGGDDGDENAREIGVTLNVFDQAPKEVGQQDVVQRHEQHERDVRRKEPRVLFGKRREKRPKIHVLTPPAAKKKFN